MQTVSDKIDARSWGVQESSIVVVLVYVYPLSIQMNRGEASLDGKNATGLCNGKTSGQGDGTLEVLQLYRTMPGSSLLPKQHHRFMYHVPQNTQSWASSHEAISPCLVGKWKPGSVYVWSWGNKLLLIRGSAVTSAQMALTEMRGPLSTGFF